MGRFDGWTMSDTLRNQKKVFIGIDPDVDKSGVCVLFKVNRHITMYSYDFGQATQFLLSLKDKFSTDDFIVVIESGWMNGSNWHLSKYDTMRSAAKKGEGLGRNFQVGMCLESLCKAYDIPYRLQPPLRKCWKGKDGKITHDELVEVTGYEKKVSNQETRDATLLAWNEAQLPIRIKTILC